MSDKTLNPERLRFLEEMGTVIATVFNTEVGPDGVVEGPYDRWTPLEEQQPLDGLLQAMRLAGLDSGGFKFQQYEVVAANPYHGGKVDLKFPSQLVIKSDSYKGIHQVDLVLRSPLVAATEIQSGIRRRMRE